MRAEGGKFEAEAKGLRSLSRYSFWIAVIMTTGIGIPSESIVFRTPEDSKDYVAVLSSQCLSISFLQLLSLL